MIRVSTAGHISKQWKTESLRNTWMFMFIVPLFTVTRRWKQQKCLSTEEWINKMCHILTKIKILNLIYRKNLRAITVNVNNLGIFTVQCSQSWSCRSCNSQYISSILPLLDFSIFFNNGSGNVLNFWNAPFSHGSSQRTIFFINFQAICDKQLRSKGKMKKKRKNHERSFWLCSHHTAINAQSQLISCFSAL